mgnify:FL=1
MKHLCVVSDYNFLPKGLTLYESLLKNSKDFVLHYLCFDKKAYDKLLPYACDTLKVYHDAEFLEKDDDLKHLKEDDRKYYSYALASYFSFKLMETLDQPITYIDADIYFHQDIDNVIDETSKKSVGLFRHRQYNMRWPNGNGWFNVGVVYFKNDEHGKSALSWWADAVLHRKYPDLATCGDQRYLDAFVYIHLGVIHYENVFIDGHIGHGAPWQWQLYYFDTYQDDGCITWQGQKQKLVFSHFSQFEYSIENNTYNPSTMHHCFTPIDLYQTGGLKKIYDDYFEEIKKTHGKYNFEGDL